MYDSPTTEDLPKNIKETTGNILSPHVMANVRSPTSSHWSRSFTSSSKDYPVLIRALSFVLKQWRQLELIMRLTFEKQQLPYSLSLDYSASPSSFRQGWKRLYERRFHKAAHGSESIGQCNEKRLPIPAGLAVYQENNLWYETNGSPDASFANQ